MSDSKTVNLSSLKCSFCGKKHFEVRKFISGPDVYICNECVHFCDSFIAGNGQKQISNRIRDVLTPIEIKSILDQYVIGQEHAKKVLSVAVHNHYKRLAVGRDFDDVELEKSNILLIGPTGSGKTLLANTLARILDVPFAIADATSLTEAGYVGEDVENIIVNLLHAADGDIERASRGIVYIDEIDKISRRSQNPSITRDVSGEGVQQALLKIIEGTIASVPPKGGRKHPQQDFLHIDTTNILFICGGAFSGLTDIVAKRLGDHRMGFGSVTKSTKERTTNELFEHVEPSDLIRFGLIPEFVGRLPVVTSLTELDEEALVKILTEPKNALIRQYKRMFAMDNVDLSFDPEALIVVAKRALEQGTGARGLRAILESAMLHLMYEIPGSGKNKAHKLTITKEMVEEAKEQPIPFDQMTLQPFEQAS